MTLEKLQDDFAAALLDVGALPVLLSALADADGRAAQRLALYRADVAAVAQKALAATYPVVRALVGEEFFAALARAYAHAWPSASGDLTAYGEHFAGFVAKFEPARSLAYLADVAALEWLVHRARRAADADAPARERFISIGAQELLGARFALHPACAWMRSIHPLASIWRAHCADATLLPSLACAEWALVARPSWQVEVVATSAAEVAALAALRAGGDMQDAIAAALAQDGAFDFGGALPRWLDLALLVPRPKL